MQNTQQAPRQSHCRFRIGAGQGQLLRLIRFKISPEKAVLPVRFAGETRRQQQPNASANRRKAMLTEPVRQVQMRRFEHGMGIEQIKDRFGLGDGGFGN